MVFDDEISTVPFMMEVTIPPNWKYLVQRSSQRVSTENIGLKDTWFTLNIEKYPSKTPVQEPSAIPVNNNKTLTLSQSEPHVHKSPARKGASEFHKCPTSDGVQSTSNFWKVRFSQQSSNTPSGILSSKGDTVEKGSKIPKMINLISAGLWRSASLDNKPKNIYFLLDKL